MPILDRLTTFCDSTSLGTAQTTAKVGTELDCSHSPSSVRDLGAGKPIWLVIQVRTAVTSGGSATVNIQLASSDSTNLTSSATTHYQTGAIAVASLTTAFRREILLPAEAYKRYVGIVRTVATADLTAGAIDAYLTDKPRQYRSYDDNVSSDV